MRRIPTFYLLFLRYGYLSGDKATYVCISEEASGCEIIRHTLSSEIRKYCRVDLALRKLQAMLVDIWESESTGIGKGQIRRFIPRTRPISREIPWVLPGKLAGYPPVGRSLPGNLPAAPLGEFAGEFRGKPPIQGPPIAQGGDNVSKYVPSRGSRMDVPWPLGRGRDFHIPIIRNKRTRL